MRSRHAPWLARSLAIAAICHCALPLRADELATYRTRGPLADVVSDLNQAIIARGLKVELRGDIAKMLERTGADVGSNMPVYKAAEFLAFCSAKLSRAMMEADPANVVYCPYVVFAYEAASYPGEVTVGYRRLSPRGNESSKEAIAAADALIEAVIREALK